MKHLENPKELLDQVDNFLLDCDGVIWHGNQILPGIKETIEYLKSNGKRVLYVSNNSSQSRHQYIHKFEKFGIQINYEEIFNSSFAAAYYIKHLLKLPENQKVYVIGMEGICSELDEEGIPWFGSQNDNGHMEMTELDNIVDNVGEVGAVLMGFDLGFNYKKMARAHSILRDNPDCHFFATNTDSTYPWHGQLFPGTGAFVAALSKSTKREPVVFGKPNQLMMKCIIEKYQLDPKKVCMVGDRLDTDILFGKQGNCHTLLVLSGVTQEKDLKTVKKEEEPEFYCQSLADLLPKTS